MASKKNDKTSKRKKSGNTYEGIRKPDDPIYDQGTIVIGPTARRAQKLTREEALKIQAASGIPTASPDDPIYRRGPSTIFVRRNTKPEDKS